MSHTIVSLEWAGEMDSPCVNVTCTCGESDHHCKVPYIKKYEHGETVVPGWTCTRCNRSWWLGKHIADTQPLKEIR